MEEDRTLTTPQYPPTVANLLEAISASGNGKLHKWAETLDRWIGNLDRISRLQSGGSSLPGDGGIDNLPAPASRPPDSSGCLSGFLRIFSRQDRPR